VGHPRDVVVGLELRLQAQLEGAPRDGGRLVPDPFQVPGDLDGHGDQPKLTREGGLGQQRDGRRIQFHLQLVERFVTGGHAAGQVVIPIHQRAHGPHDQAFGHRRHPEQLVLQPGDL